MLYRTIQAAKAFPQAQVVAIDQNPIPPRCVLSCKNCTTEPLIIGHPSALPSNVEFRKLDITKAFPFADETFDIVHARLVLMHVSPRVPTFLTSYSQHNIGSRSGRRPTSRRTTGQTRWLDHRRRSRRRQHGRRWKSSRPRDECLRRRLAGASSISGSHAHLWSIPRGHSEVDRLPRRGACQEGQDPDFWEERWYVQRPTDFSSLSDSCNTLTPCFSDEEENKLGLAWKVNMIRVAQDLPTRFAEQGITPEVAKQHLEELQDPSRSITTDMYFSWSRKRL